MQCDCFNPKIFKSDLVASFRMRSPILREYWTVIAAIWLVDLSYRPSELHCTVTWTCNNKLLLIALRIFFKLRGWGRVNVTSSSPEKKCSANWLEMCFMCNFLFLQVSVFSPAPRKHYLNITPGNILHIYPPDPQFTSSQTLVSRWGNTNGFLYSLNFFEPKSSWWLWRVKQPIT